MGKAIPPLWQVLRADMEDAGLSVRRFAKVLHEQEPSVSEDSWRRTLTDLRKEGSPDSEVKPERAALFSKFLKKPPERYLRPRRRDWREEEIARLREENELLRRRVEGPAADAT